MVHKFNLIWSWFIMLITGWLPDMPATMRFRGWLFGVALKRKGKNFCVSAKVIIRGLENISIGNHVWLAPGVVMLAGSDITIEDEVMIGFNTVITDGNHTFKNGGYRFGQRNKAQ